MIIALITLNLLSVVDISFFKSLYSFIINLFYTKTLLKMPFKLFKNNIIVDINIYY